MNNTQQILQQTLSNWQHWQTSEIAFAAQPRVVKELVGGKTNRSFLVANGASKAVVRVNAFNSLSLGIDRDRERHILHLLQPTGYVPMVLFSSQKVLVTGYCEGRQWSMADLEVDDNRRALNQMLKHIQSIVVSGLETRNYVDYCAAYIGQIDRSLVSKRQIDIILSAAASIDNSLWTAVICHHDLVPENIIVSAEGLTLLDWEYAALGHPALDYVRLYQSDLTAINLTYEEDSVKQLEIIQQAMDDLWLLVQS